MPLVLFPAADPCADAAVAPVPKDTLVQDAYVYLSRLDVRLLANPKAKKPTVLLPTAEPLAVAQVAAPTPLEVLAQEAYVYLLRVVVRPQQGLSLPRAKIPLVLFPAAEPKRDAALAAPTPEAVLVQPA